eukprot:3021030-Pyramimonas_sp.AAC.1
MGVGTVKRTLCMPHTEIACACMPAEMDRGVEEGFRGGLHLPLAAMGTCRLTPSQPSCSLLRALARVGGVSSALSGCPQASTLPALVRTHAWFSPHSTAIATSCKGQGDALPLANRKLPDTWWLRRARMTLRASVRMT